MTKLVSVSNNWTMHFNMIRLVLWQILDWFPNTNPRSKEKAGSVIALLKDQFFKVSHWFSKTYHKLAISLEYRNINRVNHKGRFMMDKLNSKSKTKINSTNILAISMSHPEKQNKCIAVDVTIKKSCEMKILQSVNSQ